MHIKTIIACLIPLIAVVSAPSLATTLGITKDGSHFSIDGKPTYLNGISYYSALSIADPNMVKADLDDMTADGFNWIRMWVHWNAEGENISALDENGKFREPYMSRLKSLVKMCNERKMIVDVTMARNRKQPFAGYLESARVLARELKPYRNIYIDVGNERDIRDDRYVSFEEITELTRAIKEIDPKRICTASGRPGSQENVEQYIKAGCDFIAPHLDRDEGSSAKTIGSVKEIIGWMNALNHRMPVHLQEPFRRGYTNYQPTVEDFFRDDSGGKIAGAAGWCLHNGSSRISKDHKPFRSFCMSGDRLYTQLDEVELEAAHGLDGQIGGTDAKTLRFQAEYEEQLSHETGRRQGFAWSASVGRDMAGVLSRGPDIEGVSSGKVTWKVRSFGRASDEQVLVLYVYSGGEAFAEKVILGRELKPVGKVLAEKTILGSDFKTAGKWQTFSLDFKGAKGQPLEFRTYWTGKADVELDHITLKIGARI